MTERWACKGYTRCGGARDFVVHGMDTRNRETWDVLETQFCNISFLTLIRGCRYGCQKPCASLCELFFIFVLEFILSTLKLLLAQHIQKPIFVQCEWFQLLTHPGTVLRITIWADGHCFNSNIFECN